VSAPPLLVLGVRRSGTTLLRVMLDRHSALAVPDESYFIPQLAGRQGSTIEVDSFVDDLRRLPTIRDWEIPLDEVRSRLRPQMPTGAAIAAIYDVYALKQGKRRWGDKTPMYMQYLPLLERLFPNARFVHLIRDGRDTALSFLSMPEGIVTKTWAHPKSAAEFACQWWTEVEAGRRLGERVGTDRYLETRYEELVADPEGELRRICAHAGLDYEPAMLDYAGSVDLSAKPHQQSLKLAPTPGLRDWRSGLEPDQAVAFEEVAGDLLRELGYGAELGQTARGRARLAWYDARISAWKLASGALQRSPAWRRRHPPLL
jgi:Sulfotransferase family